MTVLGLFGIPTACATTYTAGVATVANYYAGSKGDMTAQRDAEKMAQNGPVGSAALGYFTHLITKTRGAQQPLRATLVTTIAASFFFAGVAKGGSLVNKIEDPNKENAGYNSRR